MTTWADLLSDIRRDIDDDGATPRYSDDLLYTYAKDAIRDYSTWFPRRLDRVVLSGTETGPYSLPSDVINVLFVECPEDRYLEQKPARPGARFPKESGRPFYFSIIGGSLYLDGSPLSGNSVLLTYEAIHSIPSAADDNAFALTIPEADEELVRLYVKSKVNERIRGKSARLDQYRERGQRDDNPLLPEVDEILDSYYAKIASRFKGGAHMLHRPGRTR